VLRNTDAIKTFSGKAHLSVGAGVGASACHVGRVAEADFRAGDGGYAACYTYSCSKGIYLNNIASTHDFGIFVSYVHLHLIQHRKRALSVITIHGNLIVVGEVCGELI
jgi:hypothetical protein